MRLLIALLACGIAAPMTRAYAADTDWQSVDQIFSRKAAVTYGDVHRYSFPRTDLNVTLDGVTIKPALALGGWVAFKEMHDEVIAMGDLVLLESEINPVMAKMIASGIEITAVHNHLLGANPATFYMHVGGRGDAIKMATAIRDASRGEQNAARYAAAAPSPPPAIDLDTAQLDQIMGVKGQRQRRGLSVRNPAPRSGHDGRHGCCARRPAWRCHWYRLSADRRRQGRDHGRLCDAVERGQSRHQGASRPAGSRSRRCTATCSTNNRACSSCTSGPTTTPSSWRRHCGRLWTKWQTSKARTESHQELALSGRSRPNIRRGELH